MPTEIRSAALSQAERTIKELQEENSVLKRELNETKSLYKQLVTENDKETFHERRVMLLKSQLIQMERQVLLLTEALGSRSTTLLEVENSLSYLADTCRTFIAQETRSPEVPIQRAQLIKMVESAESARIKLYKKLENNTTENLAKPLLMMETFLKPNQQQHPVTMLDICSGKTDHINLKQVGKLETKLVGVYKCLSAVQHSLSSVMSIKNGTVHISNHLSPAVYERMNGQITKATSQLREVNMELLELSLLLPTAPWPALQKSRMKEITVENVLSKLPKFARSKQSDAKSLVESLLKAMNYSLYVSNLEGQVLKDEVKFHQTVYDLQVAYINDLFKVIQDGYSAFQDNTQEILVMPLMAVMKEYHEMKDTASEESLRTFLTTFKQHADQIQTAIESLSLPQFEESEGIKALSLFGETFFTKLEKEESLCREKREAAIGELDVVKSQREAFLAELQEQLAAKPEEEIDPKEEYQKIIAEGSAKGSNPMDNSVTQDVSGSTEGKENDCSCGGKKTGPLARRSHQKLSDLGKGSPKCCEVAPTSDRVGDKQKENIGTAESGKGDKVTTPSRPTPSRIGLPKPIRKSSIPVEKTPTRTPVPKKTSIGPGSMSRSRSGSLTRSNSGSRENLSNTPDPANSTRRSLARENHKVTPGIPMRSLNFKRDTSS